MNCDQFREQLCADPASVDATMQAHEAQCSACAAYAKRARAAEVLIHQALRFDPAPLRAAPVRQSRWGALAAAAVAGIAVWFSVTVSQPVPTQQLANEILGHWDHEPNALRADTQLPAAFVSEVVAGQASIDFAAIGSITYAKRCVVAGQWMSHLVVQRDDGFVTVFLIPEQSVDGIVPLELADKGLSGHIVPASAGAVAVIGENGAADAATVQQIADAIEIRI